MNDLVDKLISNPQSLSALAAVLSAATAVIALFVTIRVARAHKRNLQDSMIRFVLDLMEKTREKRNLIRSYIQNNPRPGNYDSMPGDVVEACDNVSRAFDLIGYLDRTGRVDVRFIDALYSCPFVELYESVLKYHVKDQVQKRSTPTHFWELREFYKRVEHVGHWHPANNDSRDWPRNARKWHWRRY